MTSIKDVGLPDYYQYRMRLPEIQWRQNSREAAVIRTGRQKRRPKGNETRIAPLGRKE